MAIGRSIDIPNYTSLSLYIYIYTYREIFTYICICVYIHMCIHIYVYTHVYVYEERGRTKPPLPALAHRAEVVKAYNMYTYIYI